MEKETAPKECPQRPGCFMFVTFCAKCKEQEGCRAWRKRFANGPETNRFRKAKKQRAGQASQSTP